MTLRYPLKTLQKAGSATVAAITRPMDYWAEVASNYPGCSAEEVRVIFVARAIATDASGVDWHRTKPRTIKQRDLAESWANRANGMMAELRAMSRADREAVFSAIAAGDPLRAAELFRKARS